MSDSAAQRVQFSVERALLNADTPYVVDACESALGSLDPTSQAEFLISFSGRLLRKDPIPSHAVDYLIRKYELPDNMTQFQATPALHRNMVALLENYRRQLGLSEHASFPVTASDARLSQTRRRTLISTVIIGLVFLAVAIVMNIIDRPDRLVEAGGFAPVTTKAVVSVIKLDTAAGRGHLVTLSQGQKVWVSTDTAAPVDKETLFVANLQFRTISSEDFKAVDAAVQQISGQQHQLRLTETQFGGHHWAFYTTDVPALRQALTRIKLPATAYFFGAERTDKTRDTLRRYQTLIAEKSEQ